MTVKCKHAINCGLINGSCCEIEEYHRPSYGVCLLVCTKYNGSDRAAAIIELTNSISKQAQAPKPGKLIRIAIHFLLDCVDAFIRRRNRLKLYIIDKIKSCISCKEREIKIDIYASKLMAKLYSCIGGRVNV